MALRAGGRGAEAASPPSALRRLARILAADGVRDEIITATVWLIQRLRRPQRNKLILDHQIALPSGQTLWSDPDGEHLLITVTLAAGGRRHIHWHQPPDAGSARDGRPAFTRL